MSYPEISSSYPINTQEHEIEVTIKGYFRCFCNYDINKLPSCDTMYYDINKLPSCDTMYSDLNATCYNKAIWNKIYNELYKKFSQ